MNSGTKKKVVTTPNPTDSGGKISTSAQKKLIQSRLPFAKLPTTPPSAEVAAGATKKDAETRKRKMPSAENDDSSIPAMKISRKSSDVKENIEELTTTDVVVVNDEPILIDDTNVNEKNTVNSVAEIDMAGIEVLSDDAEMNGTMATDNEKNQKILIRMSFGSAKKSKKKKKEEKIEGDEKAAKLSSIEKTKVSESQKCPSPIIPVAEDEKMKIEDILKTVEDGDGDKNIFTKEIPKAEEDDVIVLDEKSPKIKNEEILKDVEDGDGEISPKAGEDSVVELDDKTPADNSTVLSDRSKRVRKSLSDVTSTPTRDKPNLIGVVSLSAEKSLTPRQLQKKAEMEKRNEEKQRAKEEREKKLNEEKEARRKEREEKELARKKERDEKEEQKRKEREEKEEQRKKERDEREKKRLDELNQKNEEKRKREEQKEEERKKKEKEKEEEENKKKRAAEMFTKFFDIKKGVDRRTSSDDPKNITANPGLGDNQNQNFMPFQIKESMHLAPLIRRQLKDNEKSTLEKFVNDGGEIPAKDVSNYLKKLKDPEYPIGRSGRTIIPMQEDPDDLIIVEDELGDAGATIEDSKPKQTYRAKFFLFEENRRPPYYGTWRKKSTAVRARRPFVSDTKYFDYEVDSDDEWEEEEPGESLHGSDDEEKDKESDDDYEVDNEFFVPHGYLSDEENKEEDEVDEDNHPETQKAKLKILQQEFAAEMKKKTEKIKPKLIGCIWEHTIDSCPQVIRNLLEARAMMFEGEILMKKIEANLTGGTGNSPSTDSLMGGAEERTKKQKLNDDDVKDLISLVHGNQHSRDFLVKEYLAYRATKSYEGEPVTKVKISSKIKEIAEWKKCPMQNKLCWNVFPEKMKEFDVEDPTLPNKWNYITKPTRIETRTTPQQQSEIQPANDVVSEPKSVSSVNLNITRFAKVLTDEEKREKFNVNSTSSPQPSSRTKIQKSGQQKEGTEGNTNRVVTHKRRSSSTLQSNSTKNGEPPTKKRVPLLMSVPRGAQIPDKTKNNLINMFLKTESSKRTGKVVNGSQNANDLAINQKSSETPTNSDEVITLDD